MAAKHLAIAAATGGGACRGAGPENANAWRLTTSRTPLCSLAEENGGLLLKACRKDFGWRQLPRERLPQPPDPRS